MTSIWHSTPPAISLRNEFDDLILGKEGTLGIGQILIIRKMSRDGTRCVCWDENSGSSSDCRYCSGEGYEWTEEYIRAWFTQTYGRSLAAGTNLDRLLEEGRWDHDKALIYSRYDSGPETGDMVFRIRVNTDGNPYYPIERVEKWKVVNSEDRREEFGAVAFYILVCERVEV